jgi:hypothetical protein
MVMSTIVKTVLAKIARSGASQASKSGLTISSKQLAALKKHLGSAVANKPMPKGSGSMLRQESKIEKALKSTLPSPTTKFFTSKKKGGGMATRGMGAALRGGGMALRGMGAAYKKK